MSTVFQGVLVGIDLGVKQTGMARAEANGGKVKGGAQPPTLPKQREGWGPRGKPSEKAGPPAVRIR